MEKSRSWGCGFLAPLGAMLLQLGLSRLGSQAIWLRATEACFGSPLGVMKPSGRESE